MQTFLPLLLVMVPVLAVACFALVYLRQRRRVRRLADRAREAGMSFSRDDVFELPVRYAGMALVGGGHSPWAANVTHGQFEGLAVRSFDLRLEAGHGPRRLLRQYAVTVVETGGPLSELILWNSRFAEDAPLQARRVDGKAGEWAFRGPAPSAETLAEACEGLESRLVCLQLHGGALLAAAVTAKRLDYGLSADELAGLVRAVRKLHCPGGSASLCAKA